MVATLGARDELGLSATVHPDDVASGNALSRAVDERTVTANAELRRPDRVSDEDGRSSDLAQIDVEGHDLDRGGPFANEREIAFGNVGADPSLEQNAMLGRVRGEVRNLHGPAPADDREQKAPVSGDRVGIRVP